MKVERQRGTRGRKLQVRFLMHLGSFALGFVTLLSTFGEESNANILEVVGT